MMSLLKDPCRILVQNCCLLILMTCCQVSVVAGQVNQDLAQQARQSLKKAIEYFYSINIEGGYVYHYSLDLQEKWGEGKTDDHTIEVQPPGTPAVGMSFLRVYQITEDSMALQAAIDAAQALIRGQNEFGGWEHKIHFNKPKGKRVSFDDDQTQRAISFLMALDQEVDLPVLSASIEIALDMMLRAQLPHGGWPHRYPADGSYHDYATFNDQGINDCIRVMIEAHRNYGTQKYLESLIKAGRFLMISQLPPPQPGWAQQYNEFLQPGESAWARSFEPPAVCPSASLHNVQSLIDLYLHTGQQGYLEAIPDVLRWIGESKLSNGLWGRFLEIGTNKPLYYDRGRVRVNTVEELSLERRTGYGYETDLTAALENARARFEMVRDLPINHFPYQHNPEDKAQQQMRSRELEPILIKVMKAQDNQGRWIVRADQFRRHMPAQKWDGEYRREDRISSALFNDNVALLCEYLELSQVLGVD